MFKSPETIGAEEKRVRTTTTQGRLSGERGPPARGPPHRPRPLADERSAHFSFAVGYGSGVTARRGASSPNIRHVRRRGWLGVLDLLAPEGALSPCIQVGG